MQQRACRDSGCDCHNHCSNHVLSLYGCCKLPSSFMGFPQSLNILACISYFSSELFWQHWMAKSQTPKFFWSYKAVERVKVYTALINLKTTSIEALREPHTGRWRGWRQQCMWGPINHAVLLKRHNQFSLISSIYFLWCMIFSKIILQSSGSQNI